MAKAKKADATENSVCCEGSVSDLKSDKPRVDRFEATTYKSSRNGYDIDRIVVHYTTSRNIDATIRWFQTAPAGKRVSAHYVIGQDGELVQMVEDGFAAWHAGKSLENLRSIGIEHVAAPGDAITAKQSKTSIQLLRWLMEVYEVSVQDVVPHVWIKPTSCCGDLFTQYGGGSGKDRVTQYKAVQKWLASNGIS